MTLFFIALFVLITQMCSSIAGLVHEEQYVYRLGQHYKHMNKSLKHVSSWACNSVLI